MFTFDEAFFSNFFITILNLLVLFFILKKILFNRVNDFMDNRNNKIQEAIDSANSMKEDVENLKAEYAERLKNAGEEGKKIIEEQRTLALNEYNSAIDSAKKDARTIIDNARKEIDIEKAKAITEIKKEVGNLVVTASEKVIKKNMDNETNRKLISDFLEDSGVA